MKTKRTYAKGLGQRPLHDPVRKYIQMAGTMMMTSDDLEGVNTFGVKHMLDKDEGVIQIDTEGVKCWISKRPLYCDRGMYMLNITNLPNTFGVVDGADYFPRYFFKLGNLFDELNEWLKFNEETLKRAEKQRSRYEDDTTGTQSEAL